MKTIFFIIDTLEAGGSERVLSELSNFLSKKYKIFLITISQPRKVKDFYLLNKNIKRIRIYQNFKNEIEANQVRYEELIDKASNEISNFVDNSKLENKSQ